ncbi:GAF and ANTAR domain-containing protein [Mycobacterium sp. SMC-4]|uniref:GAF and ANTAR domain-containing protein n=1 Tax=Mycobacterium sp. SMC-4 TaxID=2857059 RepID=UPI0021B2168F|nr:GAF and ANTAR domain-containing protein [Mycobacterium sp. SMC-4]UXA18996.1 GAF and ANTAR domain-containing protein [Mycobacterium sp. SMC-4]
MEPDRATRIWTAVALRAMRAKEPLAPGHACVECIEALAVSGAGLMLATGPQTLEPFYCVGDHAGEADGLQATVGEGPGIDASATGQPVLVDDLASATSQRRWPVFAVQAAPLNVRAIHSFPLALGAIQVGALNLYSDAPRDFGRDDLVDALVYADTALLLVLDARSGVDCSGDDAIVDGQVTALWRAEVHQAAGMVSVQLGISVLDALVRLRAHAYRYDQPLPTVARAVVERRLRFRAVA